MKPKSPRPFAEFQQRFAAALRQPGGALPGLFVGKDEELAFTIYRNNVWSGWQDSLNAAYPVIGRVIGEEAMNLVAGWFCAQQPPPQGKILNFGCGFADFLATTPLASSIPWLCELAKLEYAHLEAALAGDAPRLTARDFTPQEDFSQLRLRLHPSLRLLSLDWPVDELWQAHQQAEPPALSIAPEIIELLLLRQESGHVIHHRLQAGGIAWMEALAQGETLTDALEAALAAAPDFDFATHMNLCLRAGAFSDKINL